MIFLMKFCAMVDQQKAKSLLSKILIIANSDTLEAGFAPVWNVSSAFIE